MPNVGKSSIINTFKKITLTNPIRNTPDEQKDFLAFYKGKYGKQELPFTITDSSVPLDNRAKSGKKKSTSEVCKIGAKAGVTRSIESFIISKSSPRILCLDSPGIMMPKIFDPHQAFRLAAVCVCALSLLFSFPLLFLVPFSRFPLSPFSTSSSPSPASPLSPFSFSPSRSFIFPFLEGICILLSDSCFPSFSSQDVPLHSLLRAIVKWEKLPSF